MIKFKRFRDTVTGLFTTKADAQARPAGTVAEMPAPYLSKEARQQLSMALSRAETQAGTYAAYYTLKSAVEKALAL